MQPPIMRCFTGIFPTIVMIAFGGVAAGNRNEYEHITAVGIIKYNGLISTV